MNGRSGPDCICKAASKFSRDWNAGVISFSLVLVAEQSGYIHCCTAFPEVTCPRHLGVYPSCEWYRFASTLCALHIQLSGDRLLPRCRVINSFSSLAQDSKWV